MFKFNWKKSKDQFAHIPIFGPLTNCTRSDHRSAAKEFVVILIFATATFWLTALFLRALSANTHATYLAVLSSTARAGELFIFSVAFLGPILVTAGEDPVNAKAFPGRIWHFLALVFLALIASGFYALMKIAQTQGLERIFNVEFLVSSSFAVATFAIVLRYLAIVYRKTTISPESIMKGGEQDFADAFEARHPEQNS